MSYSEISVALLLGACLSWFWLERRRIPARSLQGFAARMALLVVAALGHFNTVDLEPGGTIHLVPPRVHVHELFHYHLGTRYFGELGYTGLYDAVVLADREDLGSTSMRGAQLRDLSTNRMVSREAALEDAASVRERFSDEAWSAFKRDVAAYRSRSSAQRWDLALRDHGYNGTPLTTALLGGLTRHPWLSTERAIAVAPWLDALLVCGLVSLIAWREGAGLSTAFLFLTLANPLNDHAFIGGSYLRYAPFVALAGGLWALARGRRACAGALLAGAGWLRIFPLSIYLALLARDLAGPGWLARLRANQRLHAGFLGASALALALGSAVSGPDDRNPWLAFAENLGVHESSVGVNTVALEVPIRYTPRRAELAKSDAPDAWSRAALEDREQRRPWALGAALPLLVLATLALRRACDGAAALPALLAVYALLPVTHYDWLALSALPLALPEQPRLRQGLALLFAALALTGAEHRFADIEELRYAVLSVEVGVFLVVACLALALRRSRNADAPAEPVDAAGPGDPNPAGAGTDLRRRITGGPA